jgi:hypothetical protein
MQEAPPPPMALLHQVLRETRAARPKPSSITLVYRLDSLLVLHLYLRLRIYKQKSNKTYSCSRLIKLAQATRAQKTASSNMAAQALCEPAPNDATKSIANFKTGCIGYFEYQISGICAINYLASIDILAMEYLGS